MKTSGQYLFCPFFYGDIVRNNHSSGWSDDQKQKYRSKYLNCFWKNPRNLSANNTPSPGLWLIWWGFRTKSLWMTQSLL